MARGSILLQATMVATWLTELYLDCINRSRLDSSSEASASAGQQQLVGQLLDFLKAYVEVLDVNVTVSLLAGYGRLDDLLEYATYRQVSWSMPPTGR